MYYTFDFETNDVAVLETEVVPECSQAFFSISHFKIGEPSRKQMCVRNAFTFIAQQIPSRLIFLWKLTLEFILLSFELFLFPSGIFS